MKSHSNRLVVKSFMEELDRRGLTERRKNKYRILLRKFSKVRLDSIGKRDADKFFFSLKSSPYSDETKVDYWYMFRTFVKWSKPKLDLVSYRLKVRQKRKLPEEILTLDEVRKIQTSLGSLRDRAMVALLYDAGCRPEELLTLRRNDVVFDEDGMTCLFDGKTGPRRVRIITTMESDRFMCEYLASLQEVPACVFGTICEERLNQIVKEKAKELGIAKRVYSYIFRHTRATHLAKSMTDSQLKVYLGWSMDSKMPAVYIHLSGRDLDEKVNELNHVRVPLTQSPDFQAFLADMYQQWKNTRVVMQYKPRV